jgi:hypothetical protein
MIIGENLRLGGVAALAHLCHRPFAYIVSMKTKTGGRIAESLRRLCEAENTQREKALRQAEICWGNSFPEGEIIAIITVIELSFIGIIIITTIATSTFITIITTPSRCNILG